MAELSPPRDPADDCNLLDWLLAGSRTRQQSLPDIHL
jgi:hypothetical protein